MAHFSWFRYPLVVIFFHRVTISVSYRRCGSAPHVQIKIMDKIDVFRISSLLYTAADWGKKCYWEYAFSGALHEAAPQNPARVSGERCELLQTS